MTSIAFVQGASRGIGLQFCSSILQSSAYARVFAGCRKPSTAFGLLDLQKIYQERLEIVTLDAVDEKSIIQASETVKCSLDSSQGLDLLINCAGMVHPTGKGETSLKDVSKANLLQTIDLNALGPLFMAKHFSHLLLKPGHCSFGKLSGKGMMHSSVIVNLSARVGSIGDNRLGGWYSYRLSKSSLNMATRTLSIELGRGKHKALVISMHPGTVNTDLTRPYQKNIPAKQLLAPHQSVEFMLNLINDLSLDDSGKFLPMMDQPFLGDGT